MKSTIEFNKLFVVSETKKICFFEEFSHGLNIISGRNTSGKSTLIQSLIYTFGINDIKESLSEILSYQPIFRLDFALTQESIKHEYTIIRDSGSIYIKEKGFKAISFHGIDADNSAEHIKLKDYIRKLFGFTLLLEQKGELKTAPLESIFLPYYISQSVGWVYVRESFSNLNFYKSFKEDFLDYYLGISNNFDRVEYAKLKRERDELSVEIKNLQKYSQKADFMFSAMLDEKFGSEAQEYINKYVNHISSLEEERRNFINKCNELSLLQNHQRVLRRTKRNIKKQNFNDVDRCPACTQVLSYSLEGLYSHYQKVNDTQKLEDHIKVKLKDKQSEINSSQKKITKFENEISDNFGDLVERSCDGVTFDQWIDNKANLKLFNKLQNDIQEKSGSLEKVKEKLGNLATEEEIIDKRLKSEAAFKKIFKLYLSELKLKPLTESRYLDLYKINSFPFQGVELHKTIMAYHFAFNSIIQKANSAHRLPFLLDAILKEDIDETSLELILTFISNHLPNDTQSFISISEHVTEEDNTNTGENPFKSVRVKQVKEKYFPQNSKLIYIGEGVRERSFLHDAIELHKDIYDDTCEVIEEQLG